MDVERLKDFVVLADELHFGRTARRRLTSPQSLSRRVSDFERDLGVRLFERTSRRVALTPAGTTLLPRARRVVTELESFDADARLVAAGRAGQLRAMYSAGTGKLAGELIRRLHVERPAVDVVLEQAFSGPINDAVLEGSADVGIVHDVAGPGVASLVLCSERRELIALPPSHRLATVDVVVPADLDGETIVYAEPAGSPREPDLGPWRADGVTVTVRYERVLSEAEYLDRVGAGLGLLPVRPSTARRNQRDDVVFRPFGGEATEVFDFLVWRLGNDDPLVTSFVEMVRSTLVSAGRGVSAGA
ncbi:MAG: LysR family transcriptional regulator [Ilumatobacteraceae bacterium]